MKKHIVKFSVGILLGYHLINVVKAKPGSQKRWTFTVTKCHHWGGNNKGKKKWKIYSSFHMGMEDSTKSASFQTPKRIKYLSGK